MIEKEPITEMEIRKDAANYLVQPRNMREKNYAKTYWPIFLAAYAVLIIGTWNFPTLLLPVVLSLPVLAFAFLLGTPLYIKYREKHFRMDRYEVKTLPVTALILEEYEEQRRYGSVTVRNYVVRFAGDVEWLIPATVYPWSQKWRRVARLLYEELQRDEDFYVVLNKKTGKPLVAYPCKWFVYEPKA